MQNQTKKKNENTGNRKNDNIYRKDDREHSKCKGRMGGEGWIHERGGCRDGAKEGRQGGSNRIGGVRKQQSGS